VRAKSCAEFEFVVRTGDDRRLQFYGTQRQPNAIMPASTTSRGPSILQHLSATKKFLQDATIDAKCVWSGEDGVSED
jgi:hypothetical protein